MTGKGMEEYWDEKPLTVKMDPRIHTPTAELEKLHAEQVRMAATLDALAKADLEAHSVEEQLAKPEIAALKEIAPFVAKMKALVSGGESKGGPGLDDVSGEAAQLYGELEQADEPPTVALLAASAHAEEEGREALPRWKEFVAKDLPALNKVLRGAGRPEIDLDKTPGDMPDSGDED